MPTIFIDANIILDSYRRTDKSYRALLRSLKALAPHILLTKTVVSEVERNRVKAYCDANKLEKKSVSLTTMEMYSHYAEDTTDVDETYKGLRSLNENVQREQAILFQRIEEIHNKNMIAIIKGEDDVTQIIAELSRNAKEETSEQLGRARLRRERGMGPGKKTDPLGDQISWEQLLTHAVGTGSVWIVSRDGDYIVQVDDEVYLQPPLYRELSSVRGVTSIHCFRSLSAFFEAFSKAGIADQASLPKEEDVAKAEELGDELWENSDIPIDAKIIGVWRRVEKAMVRYFDARGTPLEREYAVNPRLLRLLPTGIPLGTLNSILNLKKIRNIAVHDPEALVEEEVHGYAETANKVISDLDARR